MLRALPERLSGWPSDPDVRHSEDFEQIIDGIFHTAKSGYNLLDNLLKWARTQTGDLEYKPGLLDMNEIFTHEDLIRKVYGETGVTENQAIAEACNTSYEIQEEMDQLEEVKQLLDTAWQRPRTAIIKNIMRYSLEHKLAGMGN